MPRAVPTIATKAPGDYLTGALWNANVKAMGDFLLGASGNGVPRFRGYAQTAQSIPDGAWTALTLDTEAYDSDGGHSTSTNTSRYTVQVPGVYLITGAAAFAGNATGNRAVRMAVNGIGVIGSFVKTLAATATHSSAVATVAQVVCVAGDYIEVFGYQNSGGALMTSATSTDVAPALGVQWIAG
ncbi:hypothetical protein [Streptomyces scabiei]|uniref:hypothetical protein n=1 Tax=Streptomyces scabiei TaxID=1930 RepID=UPI0029A0EDB7|nr:hypothetical protein [Streptomyces scabiei]MDX3126019.1 hypothetical protein [Streptomyces scabiei]MDX3203066.1 hypothetical protein [Streptomyces scabiei]MDX3223091.1 hypothetical protein [Streptomyces scabiei]